MLGSSTEVEKIKYSTVSIFSTSQIGVRTAIRYIEKFDWFGSVCKKQSADYKNNAGLQVMTGKNW